MIDGEEDAETVDEDPDDIEDVMSVRTLNQRTRGFIHHVSSIGCQSSTEKGGTKVDCNTGEPDKQRFYFCEGKCKLLLLYRQHEMFCSLKTIGIFLRNKSWPHQISFYEVK